MGTRIKLIISLATIFTVVNAFTTTTRRPDSLVISSTSTEVPKENSSVKEETGPVPVPKIYDMKINTNVTNRFAKTSVISKVKNVARKSQEATFSVVLPETAYITGFVMEIDGKSYTAYIKEKEEAKQIYSQAVQHGQAAAHVEANARDSNRFTVSVNVEPEKKAIFTLTYEELLQRENEQYEILINIHPGQIVKDLNVEVNINETRPLKFVRAPAIRSGNEISKNDNDKLASLAEVDIINSTSATVKFNPNIERQKQLASGLGTDENNGLAGQFIVQYDVERDPQGGEILLKDGYFVHFFAPSDVAPLPKHVIFVLDTSGSMEGVRVKQLKEAMNSILGELKKEDLLSIVEFSSTVRVWNIENVQVDYEFGDDPWGMYNLDDQAPKKNKTNQVLPPPFEANEENIKKAKQVVGKLNAYGGTDIKSALEVGLNIVKNRKDIKESTHQPMIIFLTDGEPTVGETIPEKITSAISELNSVKAPIFSLSFGDGADRKFLQKISLQNLGFSRHIYEAADASLQLQQFYKQISSPLLKNVSFKYVSNVTQVTKTIFPIYFRGSEFVIAGIAQDGAFLPPQIHGDSITGPVQWIPKVATPVGDLERLWAYLTCKQILEKRDAAETKTEFNKKALEIALKYSFVTPVSSLVVVKPNDTSAVDTEDASKSSQPFYDRNFVSMRGPGAPTLSLAGGAPLYAFAASGMVLRQKVAFLAPPQVVPHSFSSGTLEAEDAVDIRLDAMTTANRVDPVYLSTTVPPTTPTALSKIQKELPWISAILSENNTLSIDSGIYDINSNENITVQPECPKTPINGTAGLCTPLVECPEVFSLLSSFEIYKEYFCPLNKIAGVCCPKKATPIP